MRSWVPAVLVLMAAAPAAAGPWPRGEGQGFVSLSSLIATGRDSLAAPLGDMRFQGSLFAEYGLDADWTVGIDASHGLGFGEEETTGLLFLRRLVGRFAGGHLLGAEFGLGWRQHSLDGGGMRLRAGLSWGRGFESAWGGGWMSLDATGEWRQPGEMVWKADLTLGLRPRDDLMLIGQLQNGHYPGAGAIVKLAPSVVWQWSDAAHLQLGLSLALFGDDEVGVKIAQWFAF